MPPEDRQRTHPNVTLVVLALGGLSYSVLSSMVVPALPTMMRDLGTDETGITWLLTGYLLAASVGTAIIGRLGDMYGKEKLLLWTLVVLAFGTLVSAVTSTLSLQIAARFVQGVAGGIFPLAFGIVRDEFPREKVAGGIGLLSAILGVGAGAGILLSGVIIQNLDYHWLFWIPLITTVAAALMTWKLVPESPVRVPGRVNWLAAALMTIGLSAVLLAVSETTDWGWGGARTLLLAAFGFLVIALWVAVEVRSANPLIDMTMMRIRGVWTTNAAAFLLGGGLYASFILFPQFAQLPKSTGFGFGASVIVSGLYLLPATVGMTILGLGAGRISARFGSRWALLAGTAFTFASFLMLALAHDRPWEMLVAAALLGVGMGLAFAALGNLIVQAVSPEQTGVASGVNTVMRTLGGALGGQLSATFIASNVAADGLPTVTGFTESYWMATIFLALCFGAGMLVPKALGRSGGPPSPPPSSALADDDLLEAHPGRVAT
ncbi:MAG TPA: MFS transporter [Solirubrobacterales bacterium]|nr:MFS transporter [Solirubrobacterales bacterium]